MAEKRSCEVITREIIVAEKRLSAIRATISSYSYVNGDSAEIQARHQPELDALRRKINKLREELQESHH